eukprot:jgi/Botrbrau1/13694/Bobra.0261s0004.1
MLDFNLLFSLIALGVHGSSIFLTWTLLIVIKIAIIKLSSPAHRVEKMTTCGGLFLAQVGSGCPLQRHFLGHARAGGGTWVSAVFLSFTAVMQARAPQSFVSALASQAGASREASKVMRVSTWGIDPKPISCNGYAKYGGQGAADMGQGIQIKRIACGSAARSLEAHGVAKYTREWEALVDSNLVVNVYTGVHWIDNVKLIVRQDGAGLSPSEILDAVKKAACNNHEVASNIDSTIGGKLVNDVNEFFAILTKLFKPDQRGYLAALRFKRQRDNQPAAEYLNEMKYLVYKHWIGLPDKEEPTSCSRSALTRGKVQRSTTRRGIMDNDKKTCQDNRFSHFRGRGRGSGRGYANYNQDLKRNPHFHSWCSYSVTYTCQMEKSQIWIWNICHLTPDDQTVTEKDAKVVCGHSGRTALHMRRSETILLPALGLQESGRHAVHDIVIDAVPHTKVLYEEEIHASETVAFDAQGRLYIPDAYGRVFLASPPGAPLKEIFRIPGRPLGAVFSKEGNLLVASAGVGLVSVAGDGGSLPVVLTSHADVSTPDDLFLILYADGIDVSPESGKVYFTDADRSQPHPPDRPGAPVNILAPFLLNTFSGERNGRLLEFDPVTGKTKILTRGLWFANGVALSSKEDFLVVAETNAARLSRFWLKGSKAGTLEVWVRKLPGLPDGVALSSDGHFWVAIVGVPGTLEGLALMAKSPFLRRVIGRLMLSAGPSFRRKLMNATSPPHGLVIKISSETGEILAALEDKTGRVFNGVTSAVEHGGKLYLGSIVKEDGIPVVDLRAAGLLA